MGWTARAKPLARDLVAKVLWTSGLSRPERANRDALTVVTFHRVLPEHAKREYPFPELVVTPRELRAYVEYFMKHFDVRPLGEHAWPRSERRPALSITFDDGQLDNYEHAAPVLDAFGCRATFFVVTEATEHDQPLWHDRVGFAWRAWERRDPNAARIRFPRGVHAALEEAKRRPADERDRWVLEIEAAGGGAARPAWDGMMSWAQLRELCARGHEIGSHTVTHPTLPTCDDVRLEHELVDSRARLRTEGLGDVDTLCYPNGDHDARVRAAAERAGYRLAVSTDWGTNGTSSDPHALRRCDIQTSTGHRASGPLSPSLLALRLSGLQPGLTGRPRVY